MSNMLPTPPDLSMCENAKSALIARAKHEDKVHKLIFEEFKLNNKEHLDFISNIDKNTKHRRTISTIFSISLIVAFVLITISTITFVMTG